MPSYSIQAPRRAISRFSAKSGSAWEWIQRKRLGDWPIRSMMSSWSRTTRPRMVWLPMIAPVASDARVAARRIFASHGVIPSSPALSLIQPACTPVRSIVPSSSRCIQIASTSSLAPGSPQAQASALPMSRHSWRT
jgi:hypothetical protein